MQDYKFKECRTCKETKGDWEFYKNKNGYVPPTCKACYSAKYNHMAKTTRPHLKSKFGISAEDFNDMLKVQNNKCALCLSPHLAIPKKKWGRAQLAVDHCHITGAIRGLLCSKCNTGLGLFRDNINLLTKVIEYLKSGGVHGGKKVVPKLVTVCKTAPVD